MKATVSIPDPVFDAADKLARQLGISRSQLYTRAVRQFLESYRTEAITQALNEVCFESETTVDPILMQMQLETLADG
jgi:metal-responsive CopG/Arc/MetJ family transcriptional regulator